MQPIEDYSFEGDYQQDWQNFIFPFSENKEDPQFDFLMDWLENLHLLIEVLYQKEAGYISQMDIYFHWKSLQSKLDEDPKNSLLLKTLDWFIHQLRNMIISDNSEIRESIWYALGVNYFECGTDGQWLFPQLYQGLPEQELPELIQYSVSIDWIAKKESYQLIAKNRAHHLHLTYAILDSCNAYCFGAIKSSEALAILDQLVIPHETYKNIRANLLNKVLIQVENILPLPQNDLGYHYLISIFSEQQSIFPTWFPYAELWVDNQNLGSVEGHYLGSNWEATAKKFNIEIPSETRGRIIGINQSELQLSSKTGFLNPL